MARGKLGRPPLPDAERKRTITVYLGTRTVEQIDRQAVQAGLSRNQVIASALADYFGHGPQQVPGPADAVQRMGQDPCAEQRVQRAHRTEERHDRV